VSFDHFLTGVELYFRRRDLQFEGSLLVISVRTGVEVLRIGDVAVRLNGPAGDPFADFERREPERFWKGALLISSSFSETAFFRSENEVKSRLKSHITSIK
jgi:hypothetical protein